MPHEDFEIRITRTGQIFVSTNATGETEISDLRRFLEEAIGPIQQEALSLGGDDDQDMARLRADRSAAEERATQSETGEIHGTT
jgi:hypothetical protein